MRRAARPCSRCFARRCRRTRPPCASFTGSTSSRAPTEERATGAWWRRTRLAPRRAVPCAQVPDLHDRPPPTDVTLRDGPTRRARRLDRHAVPDGVHRPARLRAGDPVPARDGAAAGRRRLRRDHARRRVFDHAVSVHPDLGAAVGSRSGGGRCCSGASPPRRSAWRWSAWRRRCRCCIGGARVQRHRHREHRGRAGLRRRRDAARAPRARHGDHRHRVRARLHPGPVRRRRAVAVSRVRPRGDAARLGRRRAGGGQLPARAAHAAGIAAARAARQAAAARGAAGPRARCAPRSPSPASAPPSPSTSRWCSGSPAWSRRSALFTADGFGMSDAATGRIFGVVGVVGAIVQGGLVRRLAPRFGEARLVHWGVVDPGGGVRAARPVDRFRRVGRPGALHLGGVDRPRQRPDDAVAARVRVAPRERSPPRA